MGHARSVAERGVRAAGEDRREVVRLRGERAVADGVHATVQGYQRPAREAVVDLVPGQTRGQQLAARDDAVLSSGEPGKHPVKVTFASAEVADVTFARRGGVGVTSTPSDTADVTFARHGTKRPSRTARPLAARPKRHTLAALPPSVAQFCAEPSYQR